MENQIKEVFNYGLNDKDELYDRESRRLYLNNEVDENIIDSLVYMILKYNREDKDKPINEREPIKIYINTPGGSVSDGFGLIDVMLASKTPVYTINQATCYSMGFLIFLAGQKRYSMKNSTFLCHDGSSFAFGSMSKIKDRLEFETGQMEKHIMDYIVSRTTISEKLYKKNYKTEWYMYPDEAKLNGILTHIVGIDCEIDDIL